MNSPAKLSPAQVEILLHAAGPGCGCYSTAEGDQDCERLAELGYLRRLASPAIFPGANYRATSEGRAEANRIHRERNRAAGLRWYVVTRTDRESHGEPILAKSAAAAKAARARDLEECGWTFGEAVRVLRARLVPEPVPDPTPIPF